MSLSRSLTIAVGAGIAGLCLGLIIGDRPVASRAEASLADDAYLVVIAEAENQQKLAQITEILQGEGALSVAVGGQADHPHSVLVTRWPDEATAQRALQGDAYLSLLVEEGDTARVEGLVLSPARRRAAP
jgi:ureidoglycolate hydrolase